MSSVFDKVMGLGMFAGGAVVVAGVAVGMSAVTYAVQHYSPTHTNTPIVEGEGEEEEEEEVPAGVDKGKEEEAEEAGDVDGKDGKNGKDGKDGDGDDGEEEEEYSEERDVVWDSEEELKLVLVVNKGLGMSAGKVASQASHATLGAVRSGEEAGGWREDAVDVWEEEGEKIVVCVVGGEDEMAALVEKARAHILPIHQNDDDQNDDQNDEDGDGNDGNDHRGVPVFMFEDAGRTQVEEGSVTVVAFGPAPASWIDPVTKKLKLYR